MSAHPKENFRGRTWSLILLDELSATKGLPTSTLLYSRCPLPLRIHVRGTAPQLLMHALYMKMFTLQSSSQSHCAPASLCCYQSPPGGASGPSFRGPWWNTACARRQSATEHWLRLRHTHTHTRSVILLHKLLYCDSSVFLPGPHYSILSILLGPFLLTLTSSFQPESTAHWSLHNACSPAPAFQWAGYAVVPAHQLTLVRGCIWVITPHSSRQRGLLNENFVQKLWVAVALQALPLLPPKHCVSSLIAQKLWAPVAPFLTSPCATLS